MVTLLDRAKQNRLIRRLVRSKYRSIRTGWFILRGESRRVDQQVPIRAVTSAGGHFSVGYYDICPWEPGGRHILCLMTDFAGRQPRAMEQAWVCLIDASSGDLHRVAPTRAWCWQKGCMQGWVVRNGKLLIRYNDFRDGAYVTVLCDPTGRDVDVLPAPGYAWDPPGDTVLTVNFSRLAFCRPGYGYAALPFDPVHAGDAPEDDGIWRFRADSGEPELIVSLAQLKAYRPRADFENAIHHVISLSFNLGGNRFAFYHRWRCHKTGQEKTRLFTASLRGDELYLLSDEDMVSHYCWRDDQHLLAWAHQRPLGNRFYLYRDMSEERQVVGEAVLTEDGHPRYHPVEPVILLDTYPDRQNRQHLRLFDARRESLHDLGSFFVGLGFDGPPRCDLHPRWSPDGRQVCFDSSHEGRRMVYVADVGDLLDKMRR